MRPGSRLRPAHAPPAKRNTRDPARRPDKPGCAALTSSSGFSPFFLMMLLRHNRMIVQGDA